MPNALSQHGASIAMMMVHKWDLLKQMSELTITSLEEKLIVHCAYLRVRLELIDRIQINDKLLAKILGDMERFTFLGYSQRDDNLLLYRDQISVPDVEDIM